MRTADEIFKRLKYDEACPHRPENVTIGYEDRFLGIMEISIVEFENPDADIPFHRIRYFRTSDTHDIFWDRRRRIDLLTTTYAAENNRILSEPSTSGQRSPPRSGKQKKKLLQQKRLDKREDTKVQLVDEIVEEEEIELAQEAVLPYHLANINRQWDRLHRHQTRAQSHQQRHYDYNDEEQEQEQEQEEEGFQHAAAFAIAAAVAATQSGGHTSNEEDENDEEVHTLIRAHAPQHTLEDDIDLFL